MPWHTADMISPTRKWVPYAIPIAVLIWLISIFSLAKREYFGNTSYSNQPTSNTTHWGNSQTRSPYNATFGFEKVDAIVMPHRDDQLDIFALLSHTYNLNIGIFPGVYPADMKVMPRGVPDASKAPNDHDRNRIPGEIACWRAHANLWRKMLQEKWSSLLILEGDADWGVNIKDDFMKLTEVIPELQTALNGDEPSAYDDNDPYHSQSWDLLQLGWCIDSEDILVNGSLKYQSPTDMTPTEKRPFHPLFWDSPFDTRPLVASNKKMVKVSLGGACTVAYAVSPRGAAKLLHKTTRGWHGPVDLAISGISSRTDLVAFSVAPSLFGQRSYHHGTGQNSDIGNSKRDGGPSIVDFNKTVADSIGFDGEDSLWRPAAYVADASVTMAMSGMLWPERTTLGPGKSRSWVLDARSQIEQRHFANTTKVLLE